MHWKGRAEIIARHEDVHRTIFRNSTLKALDYALRLLAPGAVAQIWGVQSIAGFRPFLSVNEAQDHSTRGFDRGVTCGLERALRDATATSR
jgi:hypothetical protein